MMAVRWQLRQWARTLRWQGLAGLVLAAAALTAWGVYEFTSPGPLRTARTVVVPRGAGVDSIANQLADAGKLAGNHGQSLALGFHQDVGQAIAVAVSCRL